MSKGCQKVFMRRNAQETYYEYLVGSSKHCKYHIENPHITSLQIRYKIGV